MLVQTQLPLWQFLTIVGVPSLAIAVWLWDTHRNYQRLIRKIDRMLESRPL